MAFSDSSPEALIARQILLAVGAAPDITLFRNNTGQGWQGERSAASNQHQIILVKPRPLHAGLCEGSSDYIGFKSVEITPDMVGRRLAVFTAVEVKTGRGVTSAQQAAFIAAVLQAGGIAGVARSPDEAKRLLGLPV